MKTLHYVLVLLVVGSLLMVACGGKSKAPSGPTRVWEPDWFEIQDSAEYVYLYGSAERASQRAAETSAESQAYGAAARYVETYVQSMMKDFNSEAGVENPEILALTEDVTKVVANQQFSGLLRTMRDVRQMDNGNIKVWVRLALPKETLNRDLLNKVRSEEALYNRFRASQAFDELERAVQNY